MRSQKAFLLFVVLFFGVVVWMRVAPPVLAAAPGNDDFDNARFISPLAYFDVADTSEATTASNDPTDVPTNNTVWYTFTPDHRMPLHVDTFGSNYDTFLAVYTGSPGSLNLVASNNDYDGPQSRVHFIADPGTQYYFMVSSSAGGGGQLHFFIYELPPPANDNFANAAVIPKVPYPDTPLDGRSDAFASTVESGEPTPDCSGDKLKNSVWYAYTPSVNGSISLSLNYHPDSQVLGVYTGSSLGTLTQVGCHMYWGQDSSLLTVQVQAGTIYYIQAGNPFSYDLGEYFWLAVQNPPPPVAYFYYYPYDPSIYDDVNFYGWYSYDPAGEGIESWAWDFGDGTTATGAYVTHRYAANKDYTVTLTITTFDGRKATNSQTVSVRTYDVGIAKFSTPNSGRVGQTGKIVVSIANRLTPQTVRVELLASVPNGFQYVGTLSLYVPVQKNKTTDFNFSYSFTPQDAALGKVNFLANAYIENGHDALPGDNQAISLPVKVSGGAGGKGNVVNEADGVEMQEGFVLRSQLGEHPEMQDLFSSAANKVFLPSIDSIPQH